MEFTQFNKTGGVEGFCLIKSLEKKVTAKGVPFLDMVLADKSGEISAKLWDYKEEVHGAFSVNQLIKVRGTVSVYNDNEQLRVERIRRAIDSDGVRVEDYVPSAPYDSLAMFEQIVNCVESFSDEEIKKLVLAVLNENKEKILIWPAAVKLHHAIRGGLLYHTLTILKLAQNVCKIYSFVDSDLLYAGVILHDIAKIYELEVGDTGIATNYTVEGTLIGHLVKGAIEVERIGKQLDINSETLTLIEHMLISHHSEPEFGAAVRPMFLEAELLAQLDLMDARIYEIAQATDAVERGGFTSRMWSLENRKLYNHGRKSNPPMPDLNIE